MGWRVVDVSGLVLGLGERGKEERGQEMRSARIVITLAKGG